MRSRGLGEDYPEILNAEFIRLVQRVPEFLTDSERELYERLNGILRVRRAGWSDSEEALRHCLRKLLLPRSRGALALQGF